jgi:N-acetylmuramoyl-L-alanine amidase
MSLVKGFFRAVANWFRPKSLPNPVAVESSGRELPSVHETRQLVLGVIVGHTALAQGAKMASGESEYKYNSKVAAIMESVARVAYPDILKVITIFRDGIGIEGAYKLANETYKCDFVIELHFNAANGNARGSETLCTMDSDDIEFANAIHKQIINVFKRDDSHKDRGVRPLPRTARGGLNMYSFPGGANCLVEPFFGDNSQDAALGVDNIRSYAQGLIIGTILFARKRNMIR